MRRYAIASWFPKGGLVSIERRVMGRSRKGMGVVQRGGARSSASKGLGLNPGNVEGNFHLAHFAI